ncbi:oligosaccharide flippase family protein [Reichenbachiella versicolor]|uniref:oligosaccharide flippase family protein n=1 Tax=Reichenbachiella versicolor TaxID=1821036 RepID=UPI000D6E8F67|nr:polysaccharide biosynthesis C-terminal domain-containing protein [Reichenbachiella versicolor]
MIKKLQHFFAQGSMVFGSQMLMLGSNFLIFIILVRSNSLEQMGAFAIYMAIVTMVDTLRQGFIHHAFIKEYLNATESKPRVVSGFLVINYGMVFLFTLLSFLFTQFGSLIGLSDGLLDFLPLFGLTAFSMATLQLMNSRSTGQEKFRKQLIYNGIHAAILMSIIGVLWWSNKLTIYNYFISQFVASSIMFIIAFGKDLVHFVLPSKAWFAKVLNYGKFTAGTNLLSVIFHKADVLIISIFLTPAAVAIFHFAAKLINYCDLPMNALAQVIFPKIAKTDKADLVPRYFFSVLSIMAAMLPGVLITFFFSKDIILLIGNEEYLPSGTVLHILLVASLIKPWGRVFGMTLDALGMPRVNFEMLALSTIINVVMNLVLIPIWGLSGAAIATVASIFITISIGQIRLYRILRSWNLNPLNQFMEVISTIKSKLHGVHEAITQNSA